MAFVARKHREGVEFRRFTVTLLRSRKPNSQNMYKRHVIYASIHTPIVFYSCLFDASVPCPARPVPSTNQLPPCPRGALSRLPTPPHREGERLQRRRSPQATNTSSGRQGPSERVTLNLWAVSVVFIGGGSFRRPVLVVC